MGKRYYIGKSDMKLFYPHDSRLELIVYANAEFLSDSHKTRSQISYLLQIAIFEKLIYNIRMC